MSLAPVSVLIALGSNVGDRLYELRHAISAMSGSVRVVRISPVIETDPVDAPAGSGRFLNMVVAGWTRLDHRSLLEQLHRIEARRGRVRRSRNAPRRIDLDVILYGSHRVRAREIEIPHPRYRQRSFVMDPLRALKLPWVDPVTGNRLS